ncbi:MAG: porin [Planctomycetota bacterium]
MNKKIAIVVASGAAATAGALQAQTDRSLDETRGYAAELLADAEQRTSLLGPGNGDSNFGFASEDGNYTLNFNAYTQFRYTANFRDDDNGDDFDSGFSVARARLYLNGNIINPDTTYVIEFGFDADKFGPTMGVTSSSNTGMGKLLDAYIKHDFGNGFTAVAGQGKLAGNRESLIADNQTQLIESTTLDALLTLDRSQFVGVEYRNQQDTYLITGQFSDGAGAANTGFTDENDGDWAVTVRGDIALLGTVGSLSSGTNSMPGGEDRAVIGFFGHLEQEPNMPGVDDVRWFQFGADGFYDSSEGYSFLGQFIGRYVDDDGAPDEYVDIGFSLAGGFFVTNQTELFGSWDCFSADDDRGLDVDPVNTVMLGVNHYPFEASDNIKLSTGIALVIEETTNAGGLISEDIVSIGLREDSEGTQFILASQLQMSF